MPKITIFPSEDKIPVFAEVADRVEFIADLMEGLAWKRGKSAKILAKVWNLSVNSVEHYSAEASRQVTADRDTAAREISTICRDMMTQAFRDGKAKDAAIVGKLWADVSGANAPSKQDLNIAVNPDRERSRKLMNAIFSGGVGKTDKAEESEPEPVLEPAPNPDDYTDHGD